MASSSNVVLFSGETITSNTTTTSAVKALPNSSVELIIYSNVTSYTDGSYTVSVEHSPDGVNWFNLDAIASAQTSAGAEKESYTSPHFHLVRGKIVSTSVTSGATLDVSLWFSYRGK